MELSRPKTGFRVENDHLTTENDGLTIENWHQNGQKHNQKIRILNLKSFVTWTLVAYFRQKFVRLLRIFVTVGMSALWICVLSSEHGRNEWLHK